MLVKGFMLSRSAKLLFLPSVSKGGEGGFEEVEREGNFVMNLLLKSIKDLARLGWEGFHPQRRFNATEPV